MESKRYALALVDHEGDGRIRIFTPISKDFDTIHRKARALILKGYDAQTVEVEEYPGIDAFTNLME